MPQQPFDPAAVLDAHRAAAGLGVQAPSAPGMLEPATSTWSLILDALNKPGSALRGGIHAGLQGRNPITGAVEGWKKYVSTDALLGDIGLEEGPSRRVAGFLGDLVLDPLNFIPGKAAESAVSGARRGFKAVGDLALTHGGEAGKLLDTALTNVTPYRQLRDAPQYERAARVRNLQLQAAPAMETEKVTSRLMPHLKGRSVEDATAMMERAMRAGDANAIPTLGGSDRALAEDILGISRERNAADAAAGVMDLAPGAGDIPRYYKPGHGPAPPLRPGRNTPKFSVDPDIASFAEAESFGLKPELNAITALSRRGQQGERARILKTHFEDLTTNPIYAKEVANIADPDAAQLVQQGWTEFIHSGIPKDAQAALQGKLFAPEVAADLQALFEVPKHDPNAFTAVVDKVNNLWKPLATTIRPAFHVRNLISNIYLTLAAGMKLHEVPQRYAEAAALIKGSDPTLLSTFKRIGVLGSEFGVTRDAGRIGEDALKALAPESALALGKRAVQYPFKKMQSLGGTIEDLSRAALALDDLKKGMSLEDTALHVNKWLINYGETTKAEKGLRRWMPFYVWSRRIVPLLAESMITHPALLGAQGKLNELGNDLVPADERVPTTLRPGYVQEQQMFQLPGRGPKGEAYYGNLGLPGADMNVVPMFGGSNLLKVGEELLGRLSPIKAFAEILPNVNRAFGTGAEIAPSGDTLHELRPAGGAASLLNKIPGFDSVTDALEKIPGLRGTMSAKQLGGRTQVPAATNYLLSQALPLLEGLGKGLREPTPGQQGEEHVEALPAGVPRWLWNMLITPSVARDTPQALRARVTKAREAARLKAKQERAK